MTRAALDWQRERDAWPHAAASRFHEAGGIRWHVQRMGRGRQVLLLHGTGAATHSWRRLAPLLAAHFDVIAPDLPGHGFTGRRARQRFSLPAMAASVGALVEALGLRPALVIGHSAGAAIALRCCLDGVFVPAGVVAVNGALLPFRGAAGVLFPPLARLMFVNPLTAWMIARGATRRARVIRLIRDTGSEIDSEGIELYRRLFASPAQIDAALGMMAHWDLRRLVREACGLEIPLLLLAAERDRAVAPEQADRVAARVASARVERLPGLGHLAHEEDPAAVAERVIRFADGMADGGACRIGA